MVTHKCEVGSKAARGGPLVMYATNVGMQMTMQACTSLALDQKLIHHLEYTGSMGRVELAVVGQKVEWCSVKWFRSDP